MGIAAAIGVGAVASVAGSAISSGAAKGAAKDAAAASERSAELSAQVQRETYANNQKNLTPYMNTGNAAMGQINALLGLGGTAGTPGASDYSAYLQANPDVLNDYTAHVDKTQFATPEDYAKFHYQTYGQGEGRTLGTTGGVSAVDAQKAAENAFGQYQNSSGYKFRLAEGMNALNSGYAGKGVLQSGAAMKGAIDYGQGAATAEFGNYMGALGNQQGLGLSGASALAGVGQSYANSMGNIYQQNGNNQANAALSRGQAGAQIGNTIGGLGGMAAGYGMYNAFGNNALTGGGINNGGGITINRGASLGMGY